MNDFTKKELEEIQYVLHHLDFQESMLFINKLDKKIQSMIDNYPTPECDHLWSVDFHERHETYCINCLIKRGS